MALSIDDIKNICSLLAGAILAIIYLIKLIKSLWDKNQDIEDVMDTLLNGLFLTFVFWMMGWIFVIITIVGLPIFIVIKITKYFKHKKIRHGH